MDTFIFGVAAFSLVGLFIVGVLLIARSQLVSSGSVRIIVNGDESQAIETKAGGTLLATLADNGGFTFFGTNGLLGPTLTAALQGGSPAIDAAIRTIRAEVEAKARLLAGARRWTESSSSHSPRSM